VLEARTIWTLVVARSSIRALLAGLATLAALVAFAVPQVAGASSVGIVDHVYYTHSVAGETNSTPWKALNRRKARIAIPFDIAQRPNGDKWRAQFNYWLFGVVSSGAEPYVTFVADNPPNGGASPDTFNSGLADTPGSGHCIRLSDGDVRCHVPDRNTYSSAVAAFVKAYPQVKVIGAWNEPDYPYTGCGGCGTSTGRRYYMPDNVHYMYTANCPSAANASNCGPDLDAQSFAIVKWWMGAINHCGPPQCLTVAGEFYGGQPVHDTSAPNYGWFGSYEWWLRYWGLRPYIWAAHPYGDAARGDASATQEILSGGSGGSHYLGPNSCCYTTNELPGNPRSHLWDSAAGVPYGSTQASKLSSFISAVSYLNSSGGPSYSTGRVPRIYIYNWENCYVCGTDYGLVSPGSPDTPNNVVRRPAYFVVQAATP
jgi:hypothetical protein